MANKITESGRRSGAVLELLMQRSRLSARKLAELVGVSHTTVYARTKGQDWTYRDKDAFADLFGVPETLFDMEVADAGQWLINNGRFTIDLTDRETSDLGNRRSTWNERVESDVLALAAI